MSGLMGKNVVSLNIHNTITYKSFELCKIFNEILCEKLAAQFAHVLGAVWPESFYLSGRNHHEDHIFQPTYHHQKCS